MRLSHVKGRDLWMLERRLRRPGGTAVRPEKSGRKGLLVHSEDSVEAVGLALYDVADGLLRVEALQAYANDPGVGKLLVAGLRDVAAEVQARAIWLIAAEEAAAREFLGVCGFRLMAFCRADPVDARSPRLGYWKLE